MKKYEIVYTYYVIVDVEAEDEEQAIDLAAEVDFDFKDANATGAILIPVNVLDPEVNEIDE